MESVAEEVCVLRKDFEAKMLQPNERIASISDSVKVSSQSILKSTMKSAGGVSQDPPHVPDNPKCLSNIMLFGVKEEGDLLGMHKVVNSQSRICFVWVKNHGIIRKLLLQLNCGLALAPCW